MSYNIHYDIAALTIGIIVLVQFKNRKSISNLQTKVLGALIWCSMLSDVLDIVTVLMGQTDMSSPLVYLANILYLMMFNILPVIYLVYLKMTIKDYSNWSRGEKLWIGIPIAITWLLIMTTPLTKWIFKVGENGYQHSAAFILLYISAFSYMFASMFLAIRAKNRMTMSQRMTVYFYTIICLCGIILQVIFQGVLLMQYVVSVSILLVFMSIENPKNDEDMILGIYNRSGFTKYVSAAITSKKSFRIVGFKLTGYQAVREILGVENCNSLIKQMVEQTLPNIRPMRMFALSQEQFVLFTDNKNLNIDNIIEYLQNEYTRPIRFQEIEVNIGIYLYQLDCPEDAETLEDIFDIIDYSSESELRNANDVIMHAGKEILWKKRRENKIEQILQHAVREKKFEVYYQPIYSVREKSYRSAEALIRLYDDELGFVSPEEFIPMAEKNGMILDIGAFVFQSVCQMIAEKKIWEYGIDYIEVNLSVVQCMQERLHENLLSVMDEYQVPHRCINLEITETAAAVSKETLLHNMEQLLANDILFSLDDYGTGYSNISNIMKYPFELIKLDKSMVWSAMEDEKAIRVLRHTVAMLRDLNLHIVAEGVETEKQAAELENMGCDYFQGFLFSKPVPGDIFLEKVKEMNQ